MKRYIVALLVVLPSIGVSPGASLLASVDRTVSSVEVSSRGSFKRDGVPASYLSSHPLKVAPAIHGYPFDTSETPVCGECYVEVHDGPDMYGRYLQTVYLGGLLCLNNPESEFCGRCDDYQQQWIDECTDPYESHEIHTQWMGYPACADNCNEMEEVELAMAFVRDRNASDLAIVINRSEGRLLLNQERRSLQGTGCSRRISLNIPMDADLLAAITVELNPE